MNPFNHVRRTRLLPGAWGGLLSTVFAAATVEPHVLYGEFNSGAFAVGYVLNSGVTLDGQMDSGVVYVETMEGEKP